MTESRKPLKRTFRDFETEATYHEEGAILEFTEQLIAAMQKRGLKRSELAKRLGTSKPYITEVLSGSTNFSFRTAVRLALAVGKGFRSILEDRTVGSFCFEGIDFTSKAADAEAAVSSFHDASWSFETTASLPMVDEGTCTVA